MATKTPKAKTKRRPSSKSKVKRTRSKPLLAEPAQVRTAERSRTTRKGASEGRPSAFSNNATVAMIGMMGRVMGMYAELPARLLQCRSPMDFWLEQMRFTQRVIHEFQPNRPARPLVG